MGMFDYVTIDPYFFLMSDESLEDPYETKAYQTKDLENALFNYDIDRDGTLLLEGKRVKTHLEKSVWWTIGTEIL